MATEFKLDPTQLENLEKNIGKLQEIGETTANEVLHTEGNREVMDRITEILPISKRKKRHAKDSKPFKSNDYNLGFTIISKGGAANKKGSYGYLVFPDEGRGIRNPITQNFTGRGLERATPTVIEKLSNAIVSKIEEGI